MNILIPMAGRGTRMGQFNSQNVSKPFIEFGGKTMIEHSMESIKLDAKWIFVVRDVADKARMEDVAKKNGVRHEVIAMETDTEGPAATCLAASNVLDLNEELIIANCDQVIDWSVDDFLSVARNYHGCVVTYFSQRPFNSYAKLNREALVTQIKEKEVISEISLSGIHYWKCGSLFKESCEMMIANEDRAKNGEFYVAPTYNRMIDDGLRVGVFHLSPAQHHPIGTERDLSAYIANVLAYD